MDTKKLRQKILDLAIHGKLVPQDPNDEPASVLLERIKAEKERLIKEGKIKKSKKSAKTSDTLHYENVPFEVPEGWVWTTVSDISKSILYGVSESAKSEGKYKLLRITDIQDNKVDWETVPFTDFDDNKVSSYILHNGDIVFARTGATVGKSYLIQGLSQKAIYASYLIRIQTFDLILPEYVKLFFESGYYWEQIELSSVGIGQPNVNGTILGYLNIPLPPFAEQKRIVIEIEQWLSLIDQIEQGRDDLHSVIKQTKSKILDLAIHGKLVPQDPNDEPAIELLKRINPGFTPCDNGHSGKLPQGWCNCKISDVSISLLGKTLDRGKNTGNLKKYLCAVNVKWGTFELSTVKEMPIEATELERYSVKFGDLMVCEGGDVGRAAIWTYNSKMYYQNALHRIRFKENISAHYFLYSLMYLKLIGVIDDVCKGVTIKHLTQNAMNTLKFNLPPIAEQQRIVQKIEELFSILDNIQNALEV